MSSSPSSPPPSSTTTTTTTAAPSPPPKKFLNSPTTSVSEVISGLLYQYPNKLRKLANHNVLLSSQISFNRINLLSGGGSGHEPSHAGYISTKGQMLTGAILGDIFASPSVSSILAAIRAVTKPNSLPHTSSSGCVLIVKNYTGDRLNFGMACELAKAEGRPCGMVIVADDCALQRLPAAATTTDNTDNNQEVGPGRARGVAGTVLIHKITGAATMKPHATVENVLLTAQRVAKKIGTLGVALDAVTLPGAEKKNTRLNDDTIEIGLGIHGEAGIRQSKMMTADEIAREMIVTIRDYGREVEQEEGPSSSSGGGGKTIVPLFERGDELAILVNNLGGTSNFEMSILTSSIVTQLERDDDFGFGCRVSRVYVGDFMTSFDMKGASLSILPLTGDDELKELLDADCDAPAWAKCDVWDMSSGEGKLRPSAVEIPEVPPPETEGEESADATSIAIPDFADRAKSVLKACAETIIKNEPVLTDYDTIVGDGDCGITMKRGADEILSRLQDGTISVSHPVALFATLADAIGASMGGTSGVLLELMFRRMSSVLQSKTSVDAKTLMNAFGEGVKAVAFYGGATVGSRTMMDALLPAVDVLSGGGDVKDAAKKASEGADSTAAMTSASAGRSNYLSADSLVGTPDPGAVAVALVLEAIAESI